MTSEDYQMGSSMDNVDLNHELVRLPHDVTILQGQQEDRDDEMEQIYQQINQIKHEAKLQPGRISASQRKFNEIISRKEDNGQIDKSRLDTNVTQRLVQMGNRRYSPIKGQGRIVTENENTLRLAVEENEALEKLSQQKQDELAKVNYKYKRAESEFLEVMRELSRFRGEFLGNYSLHSKLNKILQVQKKIDGIMVTKEEKLAEEISKLDTFVGSSQELFDSNFVDFMSSIKKQKKMLGADHVDDDTLAQIKAKKEEQKNSKWKVSQMHVFALLKQKENKEQNIKLKEQATLFENDGPEVFDEIIQLERRIKQAEKEKKAYSASDAQKEIELTKLTGTFFKILEGKKCFIKYSINKYQKTCDFEVFSQLMPQPLTIQAKNIDLTTFQIKKKISCLVLVVPAPSESHKQSTSLKPSTDKPPASDPYLEFHDELA